MATDDDDEDPGAMLRSGSLAPDAPEPPVVARMVIEIRSDGTRTIARGAVEDAARGERVAIEADGTTPLSLAMKLLRSLMSAPLLGKVVARGLFPKKP